MRRRWSPAGFAFVGNGGAGTVEHTVVATGSDPARIFRSRPACERERVLELAGAANRQFCSGGGFLPVPFALGRPWAKLADATIGISKAQSTGTRADAPPGSIGRESAGGVEVARADDWILVRQVFRDGKYVRARAALKAGDRLRDGE